MQSPGNIYLRLQYQSPKQYIVQFNTHRDDMVCVYPYSIVAAINMMSEDPCAIHVGHFMCYPIVGTNHFDRMVVFNTFNNTYNYHV